MYRKFSERSGYKKPREEIQLTSMDDNLRVALWNVIYRMFFIEFLQQPWHTIFFIKINKIFDLLWTEFFNLKYDEIPPKTQGGVTYIKEWFFQCHWTEVYDFVEFVILYSDKDEFTKLVNYILEKHLSGYRVISGEIAPISSEQEIEAIESAQSVNKFVKHDLDVALKLLSDKENPNYRNSIKESISAVETLAKLVSGDSKATLGSALRVIEKSGNIEIHNALRNGFLNLYGWTSDDEGIRHSLMDEPTLSQEDAIYMLVTCSAFINYLFEKSRKFDLKLK